MSHNPEHNGRLRQIVERIERLEEDRRTIGEDLKDAYADAKADGYDVRALRALVKERRQDARAREEFEALVALYRSAIGG